MTQSKALYAFFDIAEDAARRATNGKYLSWNDVPQLQVGEGLGRVAASFTRLKVVSVGRSHLFVVTGAVSLTLIGSGS